MLRPAATSSTWSERLEQGPVSAIRRLPKSQAARPRVQCQHSQLTEGNRDDTARNCVQEQLSLLYRNHLCTAAHKLQANLPTGGADNVRRKETVSTQPGAHFCADSMINLHGDHAENTQGPFSLRVERWRSTSLVLKVFKIVDKVQFGRTVGKSGCIPLLRVL